MESSHPLGPDAPEQDFLGLAFGALAFAVFFGLGLNAVVALVVRTIQSRSAPATSIDLGGAPAMVLLIGTVLACLAAAIAAWRIMSPIRNGYRQGMLSMVACFATFVISIVTMPVDRTFGRPGLVVLAVVAIGIALWIGRRIGRAPA